MGNILDKLFDLKKIPTKFIFVIWISAALILFVPSSALIKLNLNDFLKDYGKFIGISFILSSGFLIVVIFNYVSKKISSVRIEKKIKKGILKDIEHLDFHEKALLREFFIQNKQTLQLPFDNDTVVGLANIRYNLSSI